MILLIFFFFSSFASILFLVSPSLHLNSSCFRSGHRQITRIHISPFLYCRYKLSSILPFRLRSDVVPFFSTPALFSLFSIWQIFIIIFSPYFSLFFF